MSKIAQKMSFYQAYHEKLITKITHILGVPLLIFAFFIPLNWIHLSIPGVLHISLAWLALIILMVSYLCIHWQIGIGISIILFIIGLLGSYFGHASPSLDAGIIFAIAMVFGIVLQLIGHVYEAKKPALIDDALQIFIAPIFLWAEVLFMLGYYPDIRDEVLALSRHEKIYP